MKKYVCLLAAVVLLTACGKKETTVTNPPAENASEAGSPENTPVTNLPVETKTETKTTTTVNQSPTPETDLPAGSNTPAANESPASSNSTDTTTTSGDTTQSNSAFIGGSSTSSSSAAPDMTVNPAREALRRQIQQGGGTLPSPTP